MAIVEAVGNILDFWNSSDFMLGLEFWNSCALWLPKGYSGMVEVWNTIILESGCSGWLELCYAGIALKMSPLAAIRKVR